MTLRVAVNPSTAHRVGIEPFGNDGRASPALQRHDEATLARLGDGQELCRRDVDSIAGNLISQFFKLGLGGLNPRASFVGQSWVFAEVG
ncbi:MAG TPA: hypothetical protein VMU17_07085 [Elusimicrobiota bacterium]|nr:hypothetical protein [Elusimicrobiota bacterium]